MCVSGISSRLIEPVPVIAKRRIFATLSRNTFPKCVSAEEEVDSKMFIRMSESSRRSTLNKLNYRVTRNLISITLVDDHALSPPYPAAGLSLVSWILREPIRWIFSPTISTSVRSVAAELHYVLAFRHLNTRDRHARHSREC